MKYETATFLIAFFGLASAAPMPVAEPKNVWRISIPRAMLRGREVPQEHSHDRFLDGVRVNLNLNNPAKISDPVFGLLGSAAAAGGAGSITNLDCLHQATADQAFTNAKAAGNVTGQADALMYAALERNTGKVGLASVVCNETAVNPEIAAVQQHQDPASTGAAAGNKAVVLALAKQLASIGADPQEALLSGTFKAGSTSDTTGKGNSCDTQNDPDGGCIFSQNLLVDDATAAEITAAAGGVASGSAASGSTAATSAAAASVATDAVAASSSVASATDSACSVAFATVTGGASATSAAVDVAATTSAAAVAASTASATASTGSLDFGSCSNPTILFENGLDGRTQPAFVAANQADFNHGSALNIGVIAGFICQRLGSPCDASADTITACTAAEAAASAAGGTTQAAADAFNNALGVSSSSSTASASSSAVSSSAVSSAAAVATSAPAASSSAANSTASSTSTASGTNIQTFTGSLGGLPPAVIQSSGDRPFSVNGDTFVNAGAALQRSCSVQNNACSNAANSGTLAGTSVSDCGTQETACNAAASA